MFLTETVSPDQSFTWVDITSPTLEDLNEVSRKYHLNNHHLLDCLEPDHLPKFEEGEDLHFIILRKIISQDSHAYTINGLTTKIAVFFNEKILITVHRLPHQEMRQSCETALQQKKATTVNQLVLKILLHVQGSYAEFSNMLNAQIDDYEARMFIRKTAAESMENLYLLKRKAGLCRRLLLLTSEVVSALQHRQKKSNDLQDIRDTQAKLQLFYDLLSEDAQNLVSTYMSYSAQKTNEVMKVLTIFSAYFLPLTFIVGIYGMNFRYMPELESVYGYPAVILGMIIIFVLIYAWFRRRKWL
ncbi:MAG: hypothetical protein RJB03_221 [Bacteroidota bacterium]|jgi:magnesium transporter